MPPLDLPYMYSGSIIGGNPWLVGDAITDCECVSHYFVLVIY